MLQNAMHQMNNGHSNGKNSKAAIDLKVYYSWTRECRITEFNRYEMKTT